MVDRVFTNCEVRPLSGDDPASAVAVTDGTVTAVGDPDELLTAGAETVDCRGGVLLPGFVDAHTHLDIVGRRAVEADLAGADGPETASTGCWRPTTARAGFWALATTRATGTASCCRRRHWTG